MDVALEIPQKPARRLLPANFSITDWASLEPHFIELERREINSVQDLQQWLEDWSEIDSLMEEDLAWRYIKMTCNTAHGEYAQAYEFFVQEILPHASPVADRLNRKLVNSPFASQLTSAEHQLVLRSARTGIEIYRDENVPLISEMQSEQQKFGAISGAMTIDIDGQELTMQQAGVQLLEPNRERREHVYRKMQARRLIDRTPLNKLFDKLIGLRHRIALNAGFANYRDYMFQSLGRFDYSPQDCFDFHEAVKTAVMPIMNQLMQQRKQQLGVDQLRPWDLAVDPDNRAGLKPFSSGDDLLEKSQTCFDRVGLRLGNYLRIMHQMGHLDLESRKNKAPGGYNYPLDETGVPFIFMNATSTLQDVVTMVHEGGHAIHSFVTRELPLAFFKHTPSEVAELASMSMELISMKHWDVFFDNEEDLKRARREKLEDIIETLPWVAAIDKFQHWIYENPEHSTEEREAAWVEIYSQFVSPLVDWTGLEDARANLWQKQMHLFEVPFYYIEYGIAQLGAVAVWKNYMEHGDDALNQWLDALRLGYTRPIPEIYRTAGIRFDFSHAYIDELMQFVRTQLEEVL